jgi:hypothetical protein
MTASDPVELEGSRLHRLEQEIAGLRRAMASRAIIEQAKGMLAERLGCDPQSAFVALTRWSQTQNVPVARLAAELVTAGPPPVDPVGEVATAQTVVGFGWAAWPPGDRIGHWSEGLQRLLGRIDPHPPALDRWPDLFAPIDQPAARTLTRQWAEGLTATGELRVTFPEGPRMLRLSGVPGQPVDGWSLLVVVQDVTELWQTAQRARRAENAVAVSRLLLAGRGPAGPSAVVGHREPESGESAVQQP